jgi:hypothetical protein
MPNPHKGWATIIAAARFAQNPSKATLVDELRWLANNWDPSQRKWLDNIPWPLAACVGWSSSASDLIALADQIEATDVGDSSDWLKAEERWRREGNSIIDVLHTDAEALPVHKDLSVRGFPFSGASYAATVDPQISSTCVELLNILPDIRNHTYRGVAADLIEFTLRVSSDVDSVPALEEEPVKLLLDLLSEKQTAG